MKNVTGYDLSKLLAGSWGTLAVLDEVSVKVLPAPDQTRTLLLLGLADEAAVQGDVRRPWAARTRSPAPRMSTARTALAPRRRRAVGRGAPEGPARAAGGAGRDDGGARHARKPRLLARGARRGAARAAADAVVWRISCPPTEGPAIVARIKAQRPSAEAFYDWSGGLIWLALPASADADHALVRGALGPTGGHATLIRAPEAVRAAVAGVPAAAGGARRAGGAREGKLRSQGPLQSGPHGLGDADQLHPGPARRSRDRAQRADPAQVRALRLLHGDLPDLRAAGRRARQPARTHLLHQGDAGGRSRADSVGGAGTSIAACRACPA